MSNEDLGLVLIVIPFAIIFIFFAILNHSTKKSRIEELKDKLKSLPLNEKIKQRRLEMFNEINASIPNYKIKIRYLNKLISGEKIEIKKKRKPLFGPYFPEEGFSEAINKRITLGHVPSGITSQCKFLPASKKSHS
ncbi:MAG: hypothetical protein QXT73_08720 [Candidatus Methanomethylicaceae archaeon]